jgi:hypothetical protein
MYWSRKACGRPCSLVVTVMSWCACGFCQTTLGQAPADPDKLTPETARTGGYLSAPSANDGPINSVQAAGSTRADLVAGTQGKEASISYGDFSKQHWRVLVTSPLDSDSGNANFADLDGLSNATKATWERRWYRFWSVPKDFSTLTRLQPFCDQLVDNITQSAPADLQAIRAHLQPDPNAKGARMCKSTDFDDAIDAATTAPKELKKSLAALKEHAYDAVTKGVWFAITSFKVTGGRQNFDFVNVPTAAKDSEHKGVWSAELNHSVYQRALVLVAVGARYEDTYKAQKKSGTVCPVKTGVTSVTCVTGALGPPDSEHNKVLFTEIKFEPKTPAGKSLGFALSPRLSYEFSKSHWSVDVPLYLLQAEKGGFVGGIQASYHEDQKDKFSASIFVGKKFSLLDQ